MLLFAWTEPDFQEVPGAPGGGLLHRCTLELRTAEGAGRGAAAGPWTRGGAHGEDKCRTRPERQPFPTAALFPSLIADPPSTEERPLPLQKSLFFSH